MHDRADAPRLNGHKRLLRRLLAGARQQQRRRQSVYDNEGQGDRAYDIVRLFDPRPASPLTAPARNVEPGWVYRWFSPWQERTTGG